MKILVTGANGYLGQGVVKALLDNGHSVVAADFKTNYVNGAQNGNLEEIVASFDLDKKSIDRRIDALEKSRPLAESIARSHVNLPT